VRERILRATKQFVFTHGYSGFAMDDLAAELGMSKKTLYLHFGSKEDIARAVIEQFGAEARAQAEAILSDRSLNFAEKLRAWAEQMAENLTQVSPRLLRDLQQSAPELHRQVVELRGKQIPYIFGRFVEEGQIEGMVRDNIDPHFAVEFYLQAVQGLLLPATLERLQLKPHEVPRRAIDLFFSGLLTPAGRKEHEKLFPR
jgi:AcrR family transcriptional regulator